MIVVCGVVKGNTLPENIILNNKFFQLLALLRQLIVLELCIVIIYHNIVCFVYVLTELVSTSIVFIYERIC